MLSSHPAPMPISSHPAGCPGLRTTTTEPTAGQLTAARQYKTTAVEAAIGWPILTSSPCTRRRPQVGFSVAMRITSLQIAAIVRLHLLPGLLEDYQAVIQRAVIPA